ncbi:MAG: bile acid:sodium symporter [Parvibaculaceae bacterium]|nr:bile acid:sodium symporter [Parvibaculaceae bacterium]
MLSKIKIDGFVIGLVGMVALAVLWPEPGATGGFLHIEYVTSYGLAVVFFLYGLTLAPEKMKAGLMRWPVHITIQLGTFVLFPLVVLGLGFFVRDRIPPELWLGFLYIAALPSTVSSSVAMTSLARGNVPVAIFNASLSSLLGVFVTPLLMAWFVSTTGGNMAVGPVILKVVMLVLVPIALGQIARHWLYEWATRHHKTIKLADRVVILAIVYNSFSDSMMEQLWSKHDPSVIAEMFVGAIVLFFIIYFIVRAVCRFLGMNREDTIACVFCASKKSLATGVPLAPVIFGAVPGLGLIIAPLMIFHFSQLVIVSVIAGRYAEDERTAVAA